MIRCFLMSGDAKRVDVMQIGTGAWLCAAYGNGVFVMGGKDRLVWSADGIHWREAMLSGYVYNLEWSDEANMFYGVANAVSTDDAYFLSSVDGKSWTQSKITLPSISDYSYAASLVYGKGAFVLRAVAHDMGLAYPTYLCRSAVGTGAYGIAGSGTAGPGSVNPGLCFSGGFFFASHQNEYISEYGSSWKQIHFTGSVTVRGFDVAYGNGVYVGKAYTGHIYTAKNISAAASPTFEYKTRLENIATDIPYPHLLFGGGKFICVGNGLVYTSADGTGWNRIDIPECTGVTVYCAATNGKKVVVAGKNGMVGVFHL